MSETEHDVDAIYRAVVNDEQAYSIWRADQPLPPGWSDAGKQGTRQECLDHIETVWTDMRPLSLRRALEGQQDPSPSAGPEANGTV